MKPGSGRWPGARPGLRGRALGAVLAAVLPLVLVFGWLGVAAASRALEDEVARSLLGVASSVAAQWERSGEAARVERLTADSHATRERLSANLAAVRERTGVRRLRVASAENVVLVDSEPAEPMVTAFAFAQDQAALDRLFADGTSARSTLFRDQQGVPHLRAYAPLREEDRIVAVVAVEGDLAHLALLGRLRTGLLAVLLLTGAAVALATAWAAGRVSRPLRRLVRAARRIGAGDLRAPVVVEADDEVGTLACAMEQMRSDLAQRDEQMQLMLGGIAHEIRNPLGGMRLAVDLLMEEGGACVAAGERIARDVAYLERVTEEFLAFARPRPLRLQPIEVRALLQQALDACAGLCAQRRVAIARVEDERPLCMVADAEQLRGALTNLVRNAVEASPPEETVEVEAVPDGGFVRIEVRDRGHGLDPEQQGRLFEPFYTTRQQGSGLGLPLVRRVAEAHGGTVCLEARPDRGTVAVLSVPGAPAAPPAQGEREGGAKAAPLRDGSGGRASDTASGSEAGDDDFLIG